MHNEFHETRFHQCALLCVDLMYGLRETHFTKRVSLVCIVSQSVSDQAVVQLGTIVRPPPTDYRPHLMWIRMTRDNWHLFTRDDMRHIRNYHPMEPQPWADSTLKASLLQTSLNWSSPIKSSLNSLPMQNLQM